MRLVASSAPVAVKRRAVDLVYTAKIFPVVCNKATKTGHCIILLLSFLWIPIKRLLFGSGFFHL
jgi:hypothetical protein